MRSRYHFLVFLPLFLLPAFVVGLMAGCQKPAPQATAPPPVVIAVRSDFVGTETCASCHTTEAASFRNANHAHTFRKATPSELGEAAPPTGSLPGTQCVLERSGDAFTVKVPSTGEQRTLDYALGSGKTGTTYISIENKTALIEMRRSYFPKIHKWYITPGQESADSIPTVIGRNQRNKRDCILCHAVTLPPDSLHPEPKFMGVGCENCHGAGRAHVDAMTSGKGTGAMERLGKANGDRINALCGRCHRTVEEVLTMPAPSQLAPRFPVFALASSRCFQASAGKLTCMTCHNPHQNASTDPRRYEAVCVSCHAPSAPKAAFAVKGKVCPVNATSGCVSCHMPKRAVFADTALPTKMADHFIRVNR